MDLSAPLTAELLLNAVESAHDTLLTQMTSAIEKMPEDNTLTILELAKVLGFDLTKYIDTFAAHRLFVETAKEAFACAGYSAEPRRRARRAK